MTLGKLDLDRTGQTGPLDQSELSKLYSPSYELYFDTELV
jgi:hypothetical protein